MRRLLLAPSWLCLYRPPFLLCTTEPTPEKARCACAVYNSRQRGGAIAPRGLNSSQRGPAQCFAGVHRLVHMAAWVRRAVALVVVSKVENDNEKFQLAKSPPFNFPPSFILHKAMFFYVCTQHVSTTVDMYYKFNIFNFCHGLAVRSLRSGAHRWCPCVPPANRWVCNWQ